MIDTVKDHSDFFLKISINWRFLLTQPDNIFVPVYICIRFQICQNGF